MTFIKETFLMFKRDRVARNSFSSKKRPIEVYSDPQRQSDKDLNDRVAERFFVKRTKRSFDLTSVVSSRRFALLQSLKNASAQIEQRMRRKDYSKKPNFFLGPKMPSRPEDHRKFATPKSYVCERCKAKLFSVSAFVKHFRKHKVKIQCSGCSRVFEHVVCKRRHELACPKKLKLRF